MLYLVFSIFIINFANFHDVSVGVTVASAPIFMLQHVAGAQAPSGESRSCAIVNKRHLVITLDHGTSFITTHTSFLQILNVNKEEKECNADFSEFYFKYKYFDNDKLVENPMDNVALLEPHEYILLFLDRFSVGIYTIDKFLSQFNRKNYEVIRVTSPHNQGVKIQNLSITAEWLTDACCNTLLTIASKLICSY